jgi:RNA polymerase sigma-70 factor (ECF subfamily)
MLKLDNAVTALQNGDNNALSDIYDLTARLIFSTAHAITGNYQDAEDITQDTFLEIAKYAKSFKGKGGKTWILSMVRHLAVDTMRKRKPTAELHENMSYDDDYSGLEVFELLKRLDEDERQIVTYRVYAKMPYKEIAEVMELTVANIQKKYQRAISKLKGEYNNVQQTKTKKETKTIRHSTITR